MTEVEALQNLFFIGYLIGMAVCFGLGFIGGQQR